MKKQLAIDIIRYLLMLLFLYAALNKLFDYQKFTVQIGQSPLLFGYAGFLAWFIPAIEIVIAAMLAFRTTILNGLYASYGLMAMFTGYIYVVMNYAERVPCSCGGILNKMDWTEHLIFNVVFTVLALVGVLLQSSLNINSINILWPKSRGSRKPVQE